MSITGLMWAQQYPNDSWGYEEQYGYNDNSFNNNYFPDDYYYNYPQDYYPQNFYQSYYNDYRNSIININWNGFFNQYRLNPWQISQINRLNNLYNSFSSWNNYYRNNPDRWYYDRFYALERILGNSLFIIFQNNYYNGLRPIVYFQNYRRDHYLPRFTVMPKYRNININVYRVDRNRFNHNNNPSIKIVRSARENNGFRNNNSVASGGFRNNTPNTPRSNGGNFEIRENKEIPNRGGFRGNNGNTGENGNIPGGFRGNRAENKRLEGPRMNNGSRGEGGFRNNPSPRSQPSNPAPQHRQNNENRGGGFRSNLASN